MERFKLYNGYIYAWVEVSEDTLIDVIQGGALKYWSTLDYVRNIDNTRGMILIHARNVGKEYRRIGVTDTEWSTYLADLATLGIKEEDLLTKEQAESFMSGALYESEFNSMLWHCSSVADGVDDSINTTYTFEVGDYLEIDAEWGDGVTNAKAFAGTPDWYIKSGTTGIDFAHGDTITDQYTASYGTRATAYVSATEYGVGDERSSWAPATTPSVANIIKAFTDNTTYFGGKIYRVTVGNTISGDIKLNLLPHHDGSMMDTVTRTRYYNSDIADNIDPLTPTWTQRKALRLRTVPANDDFVTIPNLGLTGVWTRPTFVIPSASSGNTETFFGFGGKAGGLGMSGGNFIIGDATDTGVAVAPYVDQDITVAIYNNATTGRPETLKINGAVVWTGSAGPDVVAGADLNLFADTVGSPAEYSSIELVSFMIGYGTTTVDLHPLPDGSIYDLTTGTAYFNGDIATNADPFGTSWAPRAKSMAIQLTSVPAGGTFRFGTDANASLYTYSGRVNYGDGTGWLDFNGYNHANLSHTYATADDYVVSVVGTMGRILFSLGQGATYITDLLQVGEIGLLHGFSMFKDLTNIDVITADFSDLNDEWLAFGQSGYMFFSSSVSDGSCIEGLTNTNKMWRTFWDCPNLVKGINLSKFDRLIRMDGTYGHCGALTEVILPDNMANVTTMFQFMVGSWVPDGAGGMDGLIQHLYDQHMAGTLQTGFDIHLGTGKYSSSVAPQLAVLTGAGGHTVITGGLV